LSGIIGFVGLVIPHLARGVVGPAHARLLPLAALTGALLLVAADLVARTAAAPAEVPIGLLTAFLGAPFLLALVRRGVSG
jgi:iron complex transport system permease protein